MNKKPTPLHLIKDARTAVRDPAQASRTDGWKNLVTLLGTSADKRTASHLTWEYRDPEFFEQLYAGGGIPARIVDLVPDEACRRWIDWLDLEEDEEKAVEERFEQLDARGAFLKSWKWGRGFGGGLCHIVTNCKDPSAPLQPGEKVLALRDLTRWDVRVLTTDIEYDFGSPNYGYPRIYYLNVQMGSQYKGYPIHWTRMVRFDGQLVPRRTFIRNNYWHDSVLNRLYDTIRDYQTSNDAAAACLQDFNVDVMSMKNLANMVASGNEAKVQRRMQIIQYAKSVLNMMVLDADEEQYENKGRSLEGVADLLKHQSNRLVAETDIPHTKLLGESPDGSNATGNSTSQAWANFVQSEQDNYARPKLQRLVDIILADKPRRFHFRPLRVLDEIEQADLHLKQAQADDIYLTQQVVDPTEIAKSRFGGKEYSTDTELDKLSRDAGLFGLSGPDQAEQNAAMAPDMGGEGGDGGGDEEGEDMPPGGGNPPKGGAGKPAPFKKASKNDAGESTESVEGSELLALQYAPRDVAADMPAGKPVKAATVPIVSQMMSEPMRDPATDPHMPGPSTHKVPRTVMPTTGNGVTAQSGAVAGQPVADIPLRAEGQITPSEDSRIAVTDAEPEKHVRATQIIVRDGDKFLMGKRRDGGKWAFPGGHVEDGESHHQGAIRELDEETGLKAKKLKFLGGRMVEPEQGKSVHINLYEHHKDDKAKLTAKNDPDKEFSKFQWFSTKEPMPDDVMGELAHPNNVALQHLGLLK